MVLKEVILVILMSGSLQIRASDSKESFEEFSAEISGVSKSPDFHRKQEKHFQNGKNFKDIDAKHQFEKDYNRWDDQKFSHSHEHRNSKNYMKINEIDSHEFEDKFNKHKKTYVGGTKKENSNYNIEQPSENSGEGERKTLLYDTDVNYIDNNKKISKDSELITQSPVIHNNNNKENYEENYQNKNDKKMKRYKKNFYQTVLKVDLSNPPPANDTVLMARYIIHTVDWAALGTISGRAPTKGSPFVCVKATSDGLENASTGVPYFYMSPMDLCTQDLQKDNRVSVLVTLSETEYCKNKNLDPQDPRCAKLTLSGKIKQIKPGSEEEKFAKTALFSKHPVMATWPVDHDWYFTKLKIGQIILLDKFGGATYIKVKDYLNGGNAEPQEP